MKRVTKATLKALARKNNLLGKIVNSFDGMYDGFSSFRSDDDFKKLTPEDIDNYWMSRNHIFTDSNNEPERLSNCCYNIELKVV